MLSVIIRLVRLPWSLAVLYLSKLWGLLHHFNRTAEINAPETDVTKTTTPEINKPEAGTLGPNTQGFPAVTDDQYNQLRKQFVESLDLDAICGLASRYNNGKPCQVVKKASGSFNICFFVEFDQEGPKWIVRVPIEPALDNPWDKLLSEVTTMQYLERNTQIPIPHVHAYGRNAKLAKTDARTQMFIIIDLIPGEPLDKNLLIESEEERRRNFYSQLIDILIELRKLEFPPSYLHNISPISRLSSATHSILDLKSWYSYSVKIAIVNRAL